MNIQYVNELHSAIIDIAWVLDLTNKEVIDILRDGLDIRYNNKPPNYYTQLLFEVEDRSNSGIVPDSDDYKIRGY